MTRSNSRKIAIEALLQLIKEQTPLPVLLNHLCDRDQMKQSDRNLAMNLIYGVLRQRDYLDEVIYSLCNLNKKKLNPLVRQGLAVGLYQILFLDRIPDSAAVNETVNGVKELKLPKRLHGFVNGVLRNAIRKKNSLPHPDGVNKKKQPFLNHPKWMTSRWQAQFGLEEMISICRANNEQPLLALRVNTKRTSRLDLISMIRENGHDPQEGSYSPEAILLPEYHGKIADIPGYQQGYFQVQGEAAQLVTHLLAPFEKRGKILDACAGLGGKTSHIYQLMDKQSELTAIEPEPSRYKQLISNMENLVVRPEYSLFKGTLEEFCNKNTTLFDAVLLDAPCSGTGIIGRQPDIRWRRKKEELQKYAARQFDLLRSAADIVAPEGVLVYASCSMEPEENLEVVQKFIEQRTDFVLTDCSDYFPETTAPFIIGSCFQPRPSGGLDGFFGARLVRKS